MFALPMFGDFSHFTLFSYSCNAAHIIHDKFSYAHTHTKRERGKALKGENSPFPNANKEVLLVAQCNFFAIEKLIMKCVFRSNFAGTKEKGRTHKMPKKFYVVNHSKQ